MSVLPQRILLPTDGSEDAIRATEAASDLARRSGAELHVVHVWHDVRGFAHDFVKRELRRQGQEILDEQVEKIRASGGEVTKAYLRKGRTSNEVIALCKEIDADLLVVGSRGLGTVRRILMGSQSEEISSDMHPTRRTRIHPKGLQSPLEGPTPHRDTGRIKAPFAGTICSTSFLKPLLFERRERLIEVRAWK